MTRMVKRADFVSATDRVKALPAERRARIEAGAARIVEAVHLAEIRKAMNVTQVEAARRSGLKQGEISRIERAPERVQMQTLARYAESLGGEMKLVMEFPDGTHAEIGMRHGKPVRSRVKVEPA